MNDQFSQLIKDLEPFFKCTLIPDFKQNVLVKMPSGMDIHLSMDRFHEFFCIGIRLGELPSFGSFRDLIFTTALNANAQLPHRSGIFGYSEETHRLILFDKIFMEGISINQIIAVLEAMMKKAQTWIDSLKRSEVPPLEEAPSHTRGVFGLLH